MKKPENQMDFSFEFRTGQGSWFWRFANLPNGRGIVGAARSADEASREASAALEEIAPGGSAREIAPAMFESALAWSGILDRFGRAASGA